MGQIKGREKGMVVGNHTGRKNHRVCQFMLMFEFLLWILGACGRKGFNRGVTWSELCLGRKYCCGYQEDGLKRSKSSCRRCCDFNYVKLKVSDRISQPRWGTVRQLRDSLHFQLKAQKGLGVYRERLEQGEKSSVEPWRRQKRSGRNHG